MTSTNRVKLLDYNYYAEIISLVLSIRIYESHIEGVKYIEILNWEIYIYIIKVYSIRLPLVTVGETIYE